jgi:4-amino-4-deoxy-L-arabinose transferase-like glycosyltransferase
MTEAKAMASSLAARLWIWIQRNERVLFRLLLLWVASAGLVAVLRFPFPVTQGDSPVYDQLAWNLAQGKGYVYGPEHATPLPHMVFPPLYPFFLGLLYLLFGHTPEAGRLAQVALNLATCLLLYRTARRLLDLPGAVLAAALLALSPSFLASPSFILTETLATFLVAAWAYATVRWWSEGTLLGATLSGLTMGLATLCRPITVLFPVALAGVLLLGWWFVRWRPVSREGALVFLAVFLVVLSPWMVRNYVVSEGGIVPVCTHGGISFLAGAQLEGRWRARDQGRSFQDAWLPPREQVENDRQNYQEALRLIASDPLSYLAKSGKRAAILWLDVPGRLGVIHAKVLLIPVAAMQYLLLVLAVPSAAWLWRRAAPFVILIVYSTFWYAASVAEPRYLVPFLPLISLAAAATLVRMATRLGDARPPLSAGASAEARGPSPL